MATQDNPRVLSTGMSLPRWMKSKFNDKLDFDQSAFSPTELDDSFMIYYRNARASSMPVTDPLTPSINSSDKETHTNSTGSSVIDPTNFSKHTLQCQKFLSNINDEREPQKLQITSSIMKQKSAGTDDGFKGEAAKCGSSVIRVAKQMIANGTLNLKTSSSHNTVDNFDQNLKSSGSPGIIDEHLPSDIHTSVRRGSKSLPNSPKLQRKYGTSMYFSEPFVNVENQHSGGGLFSMLMYQRRAASHSTEFMNDTDKLITTGKKGSKTLLSAKPAEIREMNFWSPTSL